MSYDPPDNEKAHNAESIYKYVSINSEESINRFENMMRNRSLWFWPLTKQNDQNECKPVCYFGGSKNDKIKYFIEIINEEFPGKYTRESVLQEAKRAAKRPKIPATMKIYDLWGVCCFTTKGNYEKLWNEYADNHQGVVIEYDNSRGSSIGNAGMVKYTDDKLYVDILNIDKEKCYKIFTTKENKWSYESEYRMVIRLPQPKCGINMIFKDIIVQSVTIGKNTKGDFKKKIEDVCKSKGIQIFDLTMQCNGSADAAR